jgi:FkbM family methyltransferase
MPTIRELIRAGFDDPFRVPSYVMGRAKQAYLSMRRAERIGDESPIAVIRVESDIGTLYLNPDDTIITTGIIENGVWDAETTRVLQEILSPGDTFVDMGANVGYFTVLASRVVGEPGRVVSFEPEDTNYRILSANTRRFCPYDNVTTEKMGVSNTRGTTELYLSDHPGGHRFSDTAQGPSQVVHTISFDEYADFTPDVVKMDVEGAEPRVIEGMTNTLDERPTLIFEYAYNWETPPEALGVLEEFGYSFYLMDDERRRIDTEGLLDTDGKLNVLATADGRF